MTKPNRVAERSWQRTVVEALETLGYVVEHTYPLRTEHGWRTGSTLVGKPDLLALREPRMLAIELKADRGVLEEPQRAVLSLHALVPCHRAWVIRPDAPRWDDFVAWITKPKDAPQVFGFEPMDARLARRVIAGARRRKRPARGQKQLPLR